MITEAMGAAFGAAFPKDGADLAMYENNSDYVLESIGARHRFAAFELGWQAATLAERERCARVCDCEAVLFDVVGAHKTASHCAAVIRKGEAPV